MSVVKTAKKKCSNCGDGGADGASLSLQVTPKAAALNSRTAKLQSSLVSQANSLQALYLPGANAMRAQAVDNETWHASVPTNDLNGLLTAMPSELTLRATVLESLDGEARCAELTTDVARAALQSVGTAVKFDVPMSDGSFHFKTNGKAITDFQFQAS